MRKRDLTAGLRRYVPQRGPLAALCRFAIRGYRLLRPARRKPHPFDREHGVLTQALIPSNLLWTGHAHDPYSVLYCPSPPSVVRASIDAWRSTLTVGESQLAEYTFFDLGAGMGRVIMIASLYSFAGVTGIEMNPGLVEQARRNLALWLQTPRPCSQLEVVQGDATEFPWLARPLLLYMFYPFEAPVVIALLGSLERALAEGAGPIDIIYVHPVAASEMEAYPGVQLKLSTNCYLSAEDAAVDFFRDSHESAPQYECRVYRLGPRQEPFQDGRSFP
jgi:hypothetical protein